MTAEQSLLHTSSTVAADDELKIRIELGRAALSARDLAAVKEGDVIPLETLVDSLVELFVGEQLIGRGVMVVVEGKIGIQVTELFEIA